MSCRRVVARRVADRRTHRRFGDRHDRRGGARHAARRDLRRAGLGARRRRSARPQDVAVRRRAPQPRGVRLGRGTSTDVPSGCITTAPTTTRSTRLADEPSAGRRSHAGCRRRPGYDGAAVVVVLASVLARVAWRYGSARAYRVVLIEAGHLGADVLPDGHGARASRRSARRHWPTASSKAISASTGSDQPVMYAVGAGPLAPGELAAARGTSGPAARRHRTRARVGPAGHSSGEPDLDVDVVARVDDDDDLHRLAADPAVLDVGLATSGGQMSTTSVTGSPHDGQLVSISIRVGSGSRHAAGLARSDACGRLPTRCRPCCPIVPRGQRVPDGRFDRGRCGDDGIEVDRSRARPRPCSMYSRSSVARLPSAPGANGQPPEAAGARVEGRDAHVERREHVGQRRAPRVVEVQRDATGWEPSPQLASTARTWPGCATPIVSLNRQLEDPMDEQGLAHARSTCETGTSPSYGHPNAVET